MRLLHTSDWHLGRTLHGVELLEHQAVFLDHLVTLVTEHEVDAVLVAGDVYDRAIPPVEAVALLSRTLARLAEVTTVVLTPGNHDSATRLGFGADLMRDGVRVVSRMERIGTPVELTGRDGTAVLVYPLPYLDPDVARTVLAPVEGAAVGAAEIDVPGAGASGTGVAGAGAPAQPLPRSHEAVTAAAMARVMADVAARSRAGGAARTVVMAHAFVVGGQPSESERDIRVGGVDAVPVGVFDGVDYVALGHLHGPQRVGDAGVVRYAGSPLAYSFSEQHQTKSVVLVDLGATGPAVTTVLPLPVPRRLSDVTGTLDEVLGAAFEAHQDDWVRVTVTDPVRPPELYARVRAAFPHALVVQHRPTGGAVSTAAAVVTAASDPVLVTAGFVTDVTGRPATDAELTVIRRAHDDVLAAARSI